MKMMAADNHEPSMTRVFVIQHHCSKNGQKRNMAGATVFGKCSAQQPLSCVPIADILLIIDFRYGVCYYFNGCA